jgi:hypothetical protein
MSEETVQNSQRQAEKILSELKLVATPAVLEEFVKYIENLLRIHGVCKSPEILFDENAYTEIEQLDDDVEYSREYHIDTLRCDGKEYEVESEYEMYIIGEGYYTRQIVHTFRPLSVSEKKPD